MMDIGLLILRIAVGGIIAAHGVQKLAPARHGGMGIQATTGFVGSLGFRPAARFAWLLALTELVGGVALAAGFMTPVAAGALIGVMLAAIVVVHADKGFFAQNGGYEFPLALALGALAAAFTGGGEWSLDHVLGWELAGDGWGVAAAALGAVSAGAVAASRSLRLPRTSPRRRAHA
jgi:putative oxidoreductase